MTNNSDKQTIPVVDLHQFTEGDAGEQAAFTQALGEALVEYGFVAVENHGVDPQALDATYTAMSEVFRLPDLAKEAYEDRGGGNQRGYTALGREHAKGQTICDLKEFWHVGPELSDAHPLRARIPPNVWPREVALKDPAMRLFHSLDACGSLLLRAIARYLRADEEAFAHMVDGGNSVLRAIRYPGPDEVQSVPGQLWAAAHEDINLLTLLPEATEPGLELLQRDGTWLPIMPVRGQLIADSGDMLQRLTNGLFPATTHRVVAPPEAQGPRYSMPFFQHPHPDQLLSPVASCVNPANPRRWADITAEGYLWQRLEEIGLSEGPK
jgi:isopenicillin N synthase-like dioxygenase